MWNCMKVLGSWFWAYVPLRTPVWLCCLGINSTYAKYFGLCLLNFLRSDVAPHLIDSLHCFGAHIGPLIWVHVSRFSCLLSWLYHYVSPGSKALYVLQWTPQHHQFPRIARLVLVTYSSSVNALVNISAARKTEI